MVNNALHSSHCLFHVTQIPPFSSLGQRESYSKMWIKTSLILSIFALTIEAATNPDEVKNLPGVTFPLNFRHYSGYLNATKGKYLHYWFVESQRSPSNDPLLLWLNGGPGCSSLEGMLGELGPFHVSADGKSIYNNTFAWNTVANVLFLEAPAGVGFSYADNKKYSTDDDTTSYDNYLALQHFFVKFPQFKKNDFYITGESYAGVYIPTLSVRVLTGSADINFKGFAIGNGYLNPKNLTNSLIFFAYYHGLIGSQLWYDLTKYCCNGSPSQQTCNFDGSGTSNCNDAVSKVTEVIDTGRINIYNLYSDCADSQDKHSRYSVDKRNLLRVLPKPTNGYKLRDDPPCTDSSNFRKYLNQPAVREALHIPTSVQDFELCSSAVEVGYRMLYDSMRPQLLKLIGSGKLRGLIYNGDVDMACNFLGDEWFSNNLGIKVVDKYQEWMYNNQIAGFVKYYDKLTFLTIKGSGHMVPQDKPGPALKMISSFLSDARY